MASPMFLSKPTTIAAFFRWSMMSLYSRSFSISLLSSAVIERVSVDVMRPCYTFSLRMRMRCRTRSCGYSQMVSCLFLLFFLVCSLLAFSFGVTHRRLAARLLCRMVLVWSADSFRIAYSSNKSSCLCGMFSISVSSILSSMSCSRFISALSVSLVQSSCLISPMVLSCFGRVLRLPGVGVGNAMPIRRLRS